MAFYNRVRLPFYLSQPNFPAEEEVYVLANGRRRVLRSIVNKEWNAKTDWMPQEIHERLAIALRHDTVVVEGSKQTVGFRVVGAYEIDWQDFLDHPIAPAKFRGFEEEFVARLTRCGICPEVAEQLIARDDLLGVLAEGSTTNNIDLAANDSICCDNPQFYLYSMNTTYVDSVTINPDTGIASMTLKSPLPSTGEVVFFQYQIVCGNGLTDTADVKGGVDGSLSTLCEPPTNVIATPTDPYDGTASVVWTAPAPAPPGGYEWYLTIEVNGDETIVQSGNTMSTGVNLASLEPDSLYHFYVKSLCEDDADSIYAKDSFETGSEGEPPTYNYNCERYLCTNCAEPMDVVVASSTNPSLTLFRYYEAGSSPNVVLRPIEASVGVAADTILGSGYPTCIGACNPLEP